MNSLNTKRFKYLIGIDEVGRGPLAGPVAVCAALVRFDDVREKTQILRSKFPNSKIKLRDSKKLTEIGRNVWFDLMTQPDSEIEFILSYSSAKDIDKKGIAVCIRSLIKKNLENLKKKMNFDYSEVLVLLDGGLKAPEYFLNQETIIKGDDKEPIISFASIYAKVSRDELMFRMAKKLPNYLFERHKGYGTRDHITAIKKQGVSEIHRKSFLTSILGSQLATKGKRR